MFLDDMPLDEFMRQRGGKVWIAEGATELYNLLLEQPVARKVTANRSSVPERPCIIGNNTEYVKQF